MKPAKLQLSLTIAAFALCCIVVVLGAYVRLSAAGLGCPDWPGCYGHFTPSGAVANADAVAAEFGTAVEADKAWKEMIHRYAAATLGLLILVIAALAIQYRRESAVSIPYAVGLLVLVVVQGVLGMLTVTWQLKPLIVTGHLLLGLTTLAMLWWLLLTLMRRGGRAWAHTSFTGGLSLQRARNVALLGLIVLGVQIALGGWTSSNYAATACPDFPTCQDAWLPDTNFADAFVPWRGLGINYEGGVLDHPARIAVHLTHRIGAILATIMLLYASIVVMRERHDGIARASAIAVQVALALQLLIGIFMVTRGFPLWLATAHNAGAALLLLATVALNRALRPA